MSKITLSAIATALSAAVSVVESAQKLYTYVGTLMTAAEDAYAAVAGAGESKKAAVIAAAKALWEAMGETWDTVAEKVSALIDLIKSAYNTATDALASDNTATAAT